MNKELQNIVSKAAMLLTGLVLLCTLMIGTGSAASAHTHASTHTRITNAYLGGDHMYRGGWFDDVGDYLLSANGRYQLIFQTDGNLVEYDLGQSGHPALWASHTTFGDTCWGCGQGQIARMQTDGNFVIYDSSNHALFATNTVGSGYELIIGNNSNVVIDNSGGGIVWQRVNHP